MGGCLGGCLGGSRESKPGLQRGGGQSPLLPLLVARAQTPPPARCPAVAVPPLPSPTQRPLNTHPHALESGQCPQGTKGPQRPQGFDGSQFCVAQPVGHQADDGDLQRERGGGGAVREHRAPGRPHPQAQRLSPQGQVPNGGLPGLSSRVSLPDPFLSGWSCLLGTVPAPIGVWVPEMSSIN